MALPPGISMDLAASLAVPAVTAHRGHFAIELQDAVEAGVGGKVLVDSD